MKRLFSLLFPALALLSGGGCYSFKSFGPVDVPSSYTVMAPLRNKTGSREDELRALQNIPLEAYIISSGDSFDISVYMHPEFTTQHVVITPDGYLSMPLLGPVKVGGLTLPAATNLLAKNLSEYIVDPKVSLVPITVSGFTFTILGRVNRPGQYPLTPGKTRLIDAIAAASGFAVGTFHGDTIDMADLKNAYIARDGDILPVDFEKLLSGDQLQNIPLRSNDYIHIPSVMNNVVTVMGEVMIPAFVGYSESLTVVKALSYARGLKETHNPMIKIIRGGLKNPVVYTLDIDKILEGKIMDFPLHADDIVYVPPDGLSDWNIIIRKILPTVQGVSMLAGPFGNPSFFFNSNN